MCYILGVLYIRCAIYILGVLYIRCAIFVVVQHIVLKAKKTVPDISWSLAAALASI